MNFLKETKYLFKKMSNVEDGIEKCIRVEEATELPEVTKSSTVYHFDEDNLKKGTWKSCKKWIMENLMLLTTLGAVITGVTAGMIKIFLYFILSYFSY